MHDDIHECLIVMHENSFLNIHIAHDMVPPVEYFHEQSEPCLKNDLENEQIKQRQPAVKNENYPLDHQDMILFSVVKDPIADLLISSKEEIFHDYQDPLVSLF